METLILINSNTYTFDPLKPTAQRLVIQESKITAVGTANEISLDSFPNAKVIDMNGMSILPGFTDSHIHLMQYGLTLRRVNCETPTKEECIQRIQDRAEITAEGKWILGHGWNQNIWAGELPNKKELDRVSPQNPVYLTHKSLHCAWVNSATFKAIGISKETPDPKDGLIGRFSDGEPNGILYEGAMKLVETVISKPDVIERDEALKAAQAELNRFGITSVHDFDDWDCFDSLSNMESEGTLKLKVIKNIPFINLDQAIESGIKSGSGSEMLRFGWLKLFADGALGPQTAAMLEPFEGSKSIGMLFLDNEDIINTGRKAMAVGISMAVHAIGDRANREVLHGYEQLFKDNFFNKITLKPRIEHVQLISPDDISKFAQIGVTASMQPIHAVSDRDMADRYWGKRCENAYAWNSLLNSGAQLIFGSDAPVESPNPFWGIFSAISRSSLGSEAPRTSWTPEQRINLNKALYGYIIQPYLSSQPGTHIFGLKAGCSADLVVIPKDIFRIPMEEIVSILPIATMINGDWVYKSSFEIQY